MNEHLPFEASESSTEHLVFSGELAQRLRTTLDDNAIDVPARNWEE